MNWFKCIIIDKGRSAGIKERMPVITPSGLVGQVIEVNKWHSKVMVINDTNSAVDVYVSGKHTRGIAEGTGQTTLKLKYVLKNDDIEAGDKLITSGKDAIYPEGLPPRHRHQHKQEQAGALLRHRRHALQQLQEARRSPDSEQMSRKLAFLIFGVFLTICASAAFSSLPLEIAKPDVGVPFIIYGIFFLTPAEGLLAAVLFGFTQEVLSSAPAGATLFTSIGVALSCIFLKSRLYIESRYTFALVCAVAVLTESFIFLALSLLAKGETKDFYNVLVFVVPDAIVTGFLGLFMFILFERAKIRYMGRV